MAFSQTYDVFKPEIWGSKLNRAFEKKLVAARFFSNYSDELKQGGDTIWIPGISNGFTATAISTTSGAVTPTNLSDTKSSIVLSSWMGASFILTDQDKALVGSQYRLQSEYVEKMGYALSAKLDTDLLASVATVTKGVGDSATNITATTLETAIAYMESNSIPLSECAFIFHPNAYWGEIMKSDKLVNASVYGRTILATPPHNTLYGIPVYITANVPAGTAGTEGGHRNALIHKNAIVYALAGGGIKMSEKSPEALRTTYIADIMYGKKILNAANGVRIISNT